MTKGKVLLNCRGRVGEAGDEIIYRDGGKSSNRVVAASIKVHASTVWRHRKAQKDGKPAGKKGRRAANGKTAKQIQRRRAAILKILPKLFDKVSTAIGIELRKQGFDVSNKTIQRDLIALGHKALVRQKGPRRQPGDTKLRLTFCKQIKRSGNVHKLVISDEKMFDLSFKGQRIEWVMRDADRRPAEQSEQGEKLHVWGCVGPGGFKKLIFLPTSTEVKNIPRHFKYALPLPKPKLTKNGKVRGRPRKAPEEKKQKERKGIDHELYIDCVLKKVVGNKRAGWKKCWVYQQDGAKIHHTKEVKAWLEKKGVKTLVFWPPRSPDLSPQENIWAALQYRASMRQAKTIEDLKRILTEEFEKLDVKKTYSSFLRRVDACIRAGGKTIQTEHRMSATKKQYDLVTGKKKPAAARKHARKA